MRYIILLAVMLGLTSAASARGTFGFGIALGDPTGVSWKYKFAGDRALAGVLGFAPYGRLRFHADYLWITGAFSDPHFSLSYGVGATIAPATTGYLGNRGNTLVLYSEDRTAFGIRIPVGVNYMLPGSPVELSVEMAPVLFVSRTTGFDLQGNLSARIYP